MVFKCNLVHSLNDFGRNVNIGEADLPAQTSARQQDMTGLFTEESDRMLSRHGNAHHLTACAVYATGNVNSANRNLAFLKRLENLESHSFDGSRQAGTEKCIDDHVDIIHQGDIKRVDPASP